MYLWGTESAYLHDLEIAFELNVKDMDFLIERRPAFGFYDVIENLWACCCEQQKGEINLYSKYAEIF